MIKNNPILSVIVPVFNLEDKIGRCLESLIKQTEERIEIIVVNDGSTDGSEKIIRKYLEKYSNINYILKENRGVGTTRNEGLKIATGKYITHLDGDDWIEEGYKECIEVMEKYNLDCLITNFKFDYTEKFEEFEDYHIGKYFELVNKDKYLDELFKWNNKVAPAVWNKIIRRDIYEENNLLFQEDIFMGEDFSLTARILLKCKKIGKLNRSFIHYIQHSAQGSKQKRGKYILDLLKSHLEVEKFFKENCGEEYLNLILKSKQRKIYKEYYKNSYSSEEKKVIKKLLYKDLKINIKNGILEGLKKKLKYRFKLFFLVEKIKRKN